MYPNGNSSNGSNQFNPMNLISSMNSSMNSTMNPSTANASQQPYNFMNLLTNQNLLMELQKGQMRNQVQNQVAQGSQPNTSNMGGKYNFLIFLFLVFRDFEYNYCFSSFRCSSTTKSSSSTPERARTTGTRTARASRTGA